MKNKTNSLRMPFTGLFLFIAVALNAQKDTAAKKQDEGKLIEKTAYDGTLTGLLDKGFLLKTSSFHYYVFDEKIKLEAGLSNPTVTISKYGKNVMAVIQGIDNPIKCHREADVIDSEIKETFLGWSGTTAFSLRNGEVWQQDEPGTKVANSFRPKVLIYRTNEGYTMKVEGIKELLLVKKL